jgi:predicted ABC-type ATPase
MDLILVRGVSGSGKSTVAEMLAEHNVAADDYFGDEYVFDPSLLGDAHAWCKGRVAGWMNEGVSRIAVHNTFTQDWEMQPYFDLAEQRGYRVHTLVVEDRHKSGDEHGVPDTVKAKQRSRIAKNMEF